MLKDAIHRIQYSSWLPWLFFTPFLIFPLMHLHEGEVARGLSLLAFFSSAFAGIALGGVSRFVTPISARFAEALKPAVSVFGFLMLPALVGSVTNQYLGTDIGLESLGAHFIWASTVAGVVLVLGCMGSLRSSG